MSLEDSFLKKACVTPIYKGKGSKDDPSCHRPISVIPHVAKLLEKHIQSQLMLYLEDFKLITFNQSAFLKGRSTQTAIHNMFDDILESSNEGLISGACFFDLAKCFDTIDHTLLLKKPAKYGIRGSELAWFTSYLAGRSQAVTSHNELSSFKDIVTGVPQGSVLGPI